MPHKRRSPTVLLAALFGVSIVAGAFTAATPQLASAAGKPAVVSTELNEKLAARPDGGVEAVITAHDRAGLDAIERLGIDGTRLRVMPMLLVKDLTTAELQRLERSPAVRSVYHNKRHTIQMEDSTWIVGARYTWGASAPTRFKNATDRPNGYSGRGVDIAVIDTGIDGGHDDADNLVEFCDTTGAATGERVLVACAGTPGAVDGQPIAPPFPANAPLTGARGAAFDDEGHGSHVSGTVAGSGDASGGIDDTHSTIGVAPEARLHVY
ncbi:MAG: S8 family serine peptidase, partial [Chloroflexota bacterium]|nr:S8 family serine peptidase [Chloroflexota bacterium]